MNLKDEEGYPLVHKNTKCKLPPSQPHNCIWIDQPEIYESGHYRGENWQACTENQWCKDCVTGYHEVCENIEEQISEHFGFRVSLDEIAVYNLWNKVEEQLRKSKDYTSLSKLEKNINALLYGFGKCRSYRENHYKNCFRNTKDPSKIRDKRHEDHEELGQKITKTASQKQSRIRSAKRKVSKNRSAKSPKIRSVRKSPKKTFHILDIEQASAVVFKVAKPKKGRK